jgi:1-pyrroline-4-hydroxy-2-carboxylate deaminase
MQTMGNGMKDTDEQGAKTWGGVLPAATTQFRSDGSVDTEATLKHLDVMMESGVHGMIMLGTVGENCSLETSEKIDLLKATVNHIGGRIPVLTGVAEYTTAQACRFAWAAKAAGVDGLMVLPAMVYKPDERETVIHFREVAQAGGLPVMVYNNPISYGVDIRPETFAEMADEPLFRAIKESSEDPRRITDIRNLCGDRYQILAGVDDLVLESLALGIDGWVSGLVNAFPAENRLIWDLAEADRFRDAREVYRWYSPLLHLDTHPKLVQYIKLAVAECGFGNERTRAPRLPLVGEERDRVLKTIRKGIATRPDPLAFGL